MAISKHIPNTITCLNLVSGCIATVMALNGCILCAVGWIIIAAILDFFDGFAARLLKAYSAIGKDLDSLADVVSFGVAPGMIVFSLLQSAVLLLPANPFTPYIPYFAFVIPAFSGLRLAKFNNDERQSTSFIGLPVPAHALLWGALGYSLMPFIPAYPLLFIIATGIASLCTSLLLVSEIPMFSLKLKSLKWRGNQIQYILIIAAVIFISLFHVLGIAFTIILYILLSLLPQRPEGKK